MKKRIIEGLKKETVSKGSLSDRVSPGKTKIHWNFSLYCCLKQHIFEDAGLFVVGLADGYEGALELTEEIVQDVYQKQMMSD